jgi:hypothetical protein
MICKLCCCESTLLAEISMPELKKKDIAQTYRLSMDSSEKVNWFKINKAIIDRWSMSDLRDIKAMACSGRCFDK